MLGAAIIIDALAADKPVAELIVGCVVLGVLPVDRLVDLVRARWPARHD